MKHPRIQPYLAPELTEKLRAYPAARSLTVSAVMTAALAVFFALRAAPVHTRRPRCEKRSEGLHAQQRTFFRLRPTRRT